MNEKYTNNEILENPKNRSENNIIIIGTKYDKVLLERYIPPNRAIAVNGVKFGGWGISLENAAISINKPINIWFLFFSTIDIHYIFKLIWKAIF